MSLKLFTDSSWTTLYFDVYWTHTPGAISISELCVGSEMSNLLFYLRYLIMIYIHMLIYIELMN